MFLTLSLLFFNDIKRNTIRGYTNTIQQLLLPRGKQSAGMKMWREHLFFLLPFVFRNMGISTRVQVHHGEWWVEDLFIFWYVSALFPFGPLKGTLFYTIQHPSTPSTVSHHQIIQRFRATLSPGISSLSRKLHWKIYHPPYCVCICEHYRQRDHLQPCGDLTQRHVFKKIIIIFLSWKIVEQWKKLLHTQYFPMLPCRKFW